ncbi:MAG TPA: transposase [Candidatus Methylacidiphilales bacterium]|jgi:putative transposase|nr:transposase [Candidatus Methylacidiphilales bacterium]
MQTNVEDRFPKRKHPPHYSPLDRDGSRAIHFVTVCTKDRRSTLATPAAHTALVDAWNAADAFKVGRYVILPDHVHLFCTAANARPDYMKSWVRYWKSLTTRALDSAREGQFWQRDFWDAQLRREESYDAKWEYVRLNPVRHGLVSYATEWPYQGELHDLKW